MPGRRGCTRYFLNMSSSQLFRHGDCIVGALSAYGLSRINFRLKNLFFFLILAV
jgi:ABC-type glycerol-3-phosphate transport system permease component